MNIYFVLLSLIRNFVLVSRRLRPLWTWAGGGQDIIKGVYYALILTVRNPEKISCKSGTKQRECPSWVCYIHASLCRTAIGVSLCHWSLLALWWYDEHIGVGLRRCSFRLARPFSGASNREASDSAGLHAFFMSSS